MWITVEKQRFSGDFSLGISRFVVKGSVLLAAFPHLPPHLFKGLKLSEKVLVRKVICNYKKVISFSHISTAVITTNFKYKFLLSRVLFIKFFKFNKFNKVLMVTGAAK